jgi:hypothetical protein
VSNLERIVHFSPAYDGRPASRGGLQEWRTPGMKPDDGTGHTNYGVGSVVITFVLKGPKGAVQFKIGTDWYPPHVQRSDTGRRLQELTGYSGVRPAGYDVGYHSAEPMYEGQEPMGEPGECAYVPEGCACYYDGSGLRADDWVKSHLLRGGSEAVWAALEKEYRALFEEPTHD